MGFNSGFKGLTEHEVPSQKRNIPMQW